MTSSPEMFIEKSINTLGFIYLNKCSLNLYSFKGSFGLSNILHPSVSLAAS